MQKRFRCARTGMLYPADYIEEWGRKYGIGLGPVPVSEALVNVYESKLGSCEDPMKSMFPVAVCRAQVDLVHLDDNDPELKDKVAIIALDDIHMEKRSEIMRSRQRVHSSEMSRIYEMEKEFRSKEEPEKVATKKR
jgi:hypothetical protein